MNERILDVRMTVRPGCPLTGQNLADAVRRLAEIEDLATYEQRLVRVIDDEAVYRIGISSRLPGASIELRYGPTLEQHDFVMSRVYEGEIGVASSGELMPREILTRGDDARVIQEVRDLSRKLTHILTEL